MAILILKILNALLMAYLLLLSVRIVLTWFQGMIYSKAFHYLAAVTEPYLALFYRLKFLRRGIFDFTPIAAILVLVIILDMLSALIYTGRLTLGYVLAAMVTALWSGVSFILLLFLVIGSIRILIIAFRRGSDSPSLKVFDIMIQPVVAFVMRIVKLGKRAGYTQYLLLTVGFLLVFWLLGRFLVSELVSLFRSLPV